MQTHCALFITAVQSARTLWSQETQTQMSNVKVNKKKRVLSKFRRYLMPFVITQAWPSFVCLFFILECDSCAQTLLIDLEKLDVEFARIKAQLDNASVSGALKERLDKLEKAVSDTKVIPSLGKKSAPSAVKHWIYFRYFQKLTV